MIGGGVAKQGNGPFVHIVRPEGFFGVLNSKMEEFFGSPPPGGVQGGGGGGRRGGFLFFNQYHHVICLEVGFLGC